MRGKFLCTGVTTHAEEKKTVYLTAVFAHDLETADVFAKYDPVGNIELVIQNPAFRDYFIPGRHYRMDIERCD